MVRKKKLRLLLYGYQWTYRYYTIYGTFKRWSSDDFTTIPRRFYLRNYNYWLRLFQKLLRLFQPERCDYCSPLLAIGRKPEKRCGGSRQWFRAAVPGRKHNARLMPGVGSIETPPGWHGLRYAAPSGMDSRQWAPPHTFLYTLL